jgi:hypothetical protein
MNHPFDPDPESNPRVRPPGSHIREVCARPADPAHESKHLKLLDALVDRIIEDLKDNSCQPNVRDALKAIQLREKVAKTSDAERIFWNMIDDIKREEFAGSDPQFTNLQRQIQAAILPLRDSVKNAVLPVRAITEVFNNSRSEAARLTTRRMVKLLAGMGFTLVKASNGCSAILWDDELLPPAEHPDSQDSEARPGLNALPYDGPESISSDIGAATHPASPPQEFSPGLVRSPGGDEMGLSSPLVGVEDPSGSIKSKIPPFDRLRVVSEVEPPPAGERGNGSSSPPVREQLDRIGDSHREDFIQGIDVFPQNPPTPLPWEKPESASLPTHPPIHPGSPPIDGTSRRKPRIQKNEKKAQKPLKALIRQFPASRDPPKR